MNSIGLATCVVCALIVVASAQKCDDYFYKLSDGQLYFDDYVIAYNKQYKDDADKKRHLEAFMKNLDKLNAIIAKNPCKEPSVGINQFSDRIEGEPEH